MNHDYSLVFETDNEYWNRVLEIFEKNEKYPKKRVSNRNLHHKFPRSFSKMLGEPVDNDADNLISLSLADHFLVHYYYYLLAKKGFRQRMATAFTFMAKKGLKYMTPETAEQMAKDYEEALPISKATNTGRIFGPKPDEVKKRISEANKGKVFTEEHRNNISKSMKGKAPIPYSEFGKLFNERYGITQQDNPTLYYRENKYYQRHGCLRPLNMDNLI